MSYRTTFLSRLIGLYCILVALAMITRREATIEMVTAMIHNAPLLYVVGVMTVIAGLAILLGHNLWSGGALPVVVTLTGWVALIKGLLLLFLSPEASAGLFLGGLHYEQLFYLYAAISLLLGIYLTYGGMTQRAK